MYPEYKKTVTLITNRFNKYLIKEYRFDYYSYNQVEDIRQKVYFLRYQFITHKVPIIEISDISTKRTPKGYSVTIQEKFAGLDFVDLTNNENLIENISLLLSKTVRPMLSAGKKSYLPFGIDTNLRNFVFDTQNNIFLYNHFMPPRSISRGMHFIEISDMSSVAQFIQKYRFFSLTGVFYSLYLSIIFYYFKARKKIFESLYKFAEQEGHTGACDFLKGRIMLEAMSYDELVQRLEKITSWDEISYLELIHIAIITMNHNTIFKKNTVTFFKSISLLRKSKHDKLHLPKDSLNNAKIILINNLKKLQH